MYGLMIFKMENFISIFGCYTHSSHARGSSNKSKSGHQNNHCPYVPHCQIYKVDGYFAVEYPDRYVRSTTSSPQAHLALAFNAMNIQLTDASDWYMDYGTSSHMTSDASQLDSATTYNDNNQVYVGNGNRLSISHIGSRSITRDLLLRDVLVVPQITKMLLSISKLIRDLPVTILFDDVSFVSQHKKTGMIMGRGGR